MSVSVDQFVDSILAMELSTRKQIEHVKSTLPEEERENAAALARALRKASILTKLQETNLLNGRGDYLKIGEYNILDVIGKGGMGEVFKALHRRMDRVVAIKFIALTSGKDPNAIGRFEREVRAAAKLIHPHIVTAFDAGQDRGRLFLVMEYVDGTDVSKMLPHRITVRQATQWMRQAAEGLAFAHQAKIIHRDIKPNNLLVDRHGSLKILDMGLARISIDSTEATELTSSGTIMGTADYMAPEQASDPKAVDHRVDIYALGCTLFRILVGRAPYASDSMVNTLVGHRTKPIPSLSSFRPDVPEALEKLFQHMVAKRANDRPATMKEVAQRLLAIEESLEKEVSESFDSHATQAVDYLEAIPDALTHVPSQAMADTFQTIPTPNQFWQGTPKSQSSLPWILGGSALAIVLVGLLSFLTFAIVRLANRKPETIVIRESEIRERNSETQPNLPPLPEPFSDRAAAEWALALGGRVRVLEPNKESYDVFHPAGLPQTDFRVEALGLDGLGAVTDTSISRVRELTALRELSLANTPITDDALTYLQSLHSLRSLNVQECKLTDKGLAILAKREELATLLAGGNFTDKGLASLHALGKLTSVSFKADGPTVTGVTSLTKFSPNLGTLLTENFKIKDGDVGIFKNLANLRILGLINAPLTDASVETLAELKTLTQLIVQGTQISAEGLKRLQAALPHCKIYGGTYSPRRNSVRRILMAGGRVQFSAVGIPLRQLNSFNELPDDFIIDTIDFEGVRPLQLDGIALEELSHLKLTDSGIGLTDMRKIAKLFPLLTELFVDGTVVPESELVTMFGSLKNLQLLDATRTSVGQEGAAKLKQSLPNCEVLWGIPPPSPDREVATKIIEIGGLVSIIHDSKWIGDIASLDDLPATDFWIISFRLTNPKTIDNQLIERISQLRSIQHLYFYGGALNDEQLSRLATLRTLRDISVQGTKVTDVGIQQLAKRKLRHINLQFTKISPNAVRLLGYQPSMIGVASSIEFDDESLGAIVENMPQLDNLSFRVGKGTPSGLKQLTKLKNFRGLSLRAAELSRSYVSAIASIPSLEGINLDYSKIDDSDLLTLAKLPKLKWISALGCKITPQGAKKLREKRPEVEITYSVSKAAAYRILAVGGQVSAQLPNGTQVEIKDIKAIPDDFDIVKIDLSKWDRNQGMSGGEVYPLSKEPLQHVTELVIVGKDMSSEHSLEGLRDHKRLRVCVLRDTRVGDAFLTPLLTIKGLKKLDIRGTKASQAFIKELRKAHPSCVIQVDSRS